MQAALPASAIGSLARADSLEAGKEISLWIIGKYQPIVNQYIPHAANVVVFSIPNPVDRSTRPDIHLIDGT